VIARQAYFQLLATEERERDREREGGGEGERERQREKNCEYPMAKFTRTLNFIKEKGKQKIYVIT